MNRTDQMNCSSGTQRKGLLFRHCSIEDLEVLQSFSRQRYFETFAGLNSPENMAAYLDKAFAMEKLRAELLDENTAFYFLYSDGKLAGYLKVNEAASQTDGVGREIRTW